MGFQNPKCSLDKYTSTEENVLTDESLKCIISPCNFCIYGDTVVIRPAVLKLLLTDVFFVILCSLYDDKYSPYIRRRDLSSVFCVFSNSSAC